MLPTVIEEYMRRPVEIEEVRLLDYHVDAKRKKVPRHKSVVVRLAPRIFCNILVKQGTVAKVLLLSIHEIHTFS